MSWDDVWKIILSISASVGGIGVVIWFVIKFSSDIIADRLSKKYELKMNREIESYRNKLNQKNYISKARFDKEFEIYQALSEKTLDMTFANYALFPIADITPPTEEGRQELFNERYHDAVQTYNEANRTIKATALFIPEEIYKLFSELRDECCKQITNYTFFVLDPDCKKNRTESRKEYLECFKRAMSIFEKRDVIICNLREYLSKLEILE